MARLKLLTFDVKDTLLRIRESASHQYAEVAQSHGIKISESDIQRVYRKTWNEKQKLHPVYGVRSGMTTKDWWRDFVQKVFINTGQNLQRGQIDRVFETLWTRFDKANNWDLVHDAKEVLTFLKSSDLQLGIVSNFDDRLESTLRANGLVHYFDFLVTSHSAKVEKPDVAIFRKALDISRKMPDVAGHVGDDLECDYFAPRKIGMKSFLFDPHGQHTKEKRSGIDTNCVIRSLLDLKQLVI